MGLLDRIQKDKKQADARLLNPAGGDPSPTVQASNSAASMASTRPNSGDGRIEGKVELAGSELLRLLEILDDLDRAANDTSATAAQREGIGMIKDKLTTFFNNLGMEVIGQEGDVFDAARHEAVSMISNSLFTPGAVVKVLAHGLRWNGRPFKAAQVSVAQAGEVIQGTLDI